MRISPIILFSVDFIIYAIFDEDLSQDLSARVFRLHPPFSTCDLTRLYYFAIRKRLTINAIAQKDGIESC